jgi:hypothetical protein
MESLDVEEKEPFRTEKRLLLSRHFQAIPSRLALFPCNDVIPEWHSGQASACNKPNSDERMAKNILITVIRESEIFHELSVMSRTIAVKTIKSKSDYYIPALPNFCRRHERMHEISIRLVSCDKPGFSRSDLFFCPRVLLRRFDGHCLRLTI